jgi:hypothetical protein
MTLSRKIYNISIPKDWDGGPWNPTWTVNQTMKLFSIKYTLPGYNEDANI